MLELFHRLFPDVAARESPRLDLRDDGGPGAVPAGSYLFIEAYCTNPDCKCERAVISVVERRRGVVATIDYEFNTSPAPAFFDESNPSLDRSTRQSEYAVEILAMFKEMVIDEKYIERLRRHYRLAKAAGRASGSSSAPPYDGGMTNRRGEWAKQQRKQQKAARRRNRRR